MIKINRMVIKWHHCNGLKIKLIFSPFFFVVYTNGSIMWPHDTYAFRHSFHLLCHFFSIDQTLLESHAQLNFHLNWIYQRFTWNRSENSVQMSLRTTSARTLNGIVHSFRFSRKEIMSNKILGDWHECGPVADAHSILQHIRIYLDYVRCM